MTSDHELDGLVRGWLVEELDRVPEPTRAIEDVTRAVPDIRRRRPGWRGWLWHLEPWLRSTPAPAPSAPEVVLWGGPGASEHPSPVAVDPRSQRSIPLRTSLAMAAVAVPPIVATAWLVTSPDGMLIGDGARPQPALTLGAPQIGGRDIVVAADASGHFLTLAEAVAASVDGDRIVVEPGTYAGSITVDKDISIRGEGGRESVILVPDLGRTSGAAPDPRFYYFPLTDRQADEWPFLLFLDRTEAMVADLTLRGVEDGTTVVIDGGAPRLSNVVIDPDGEQQMMSDLSSHESVAIGSESRATIEDSLITAFIGVGEGSDPTLTGNTIAGSCLIIHGEGTAPVVSQNQIEHSQCATMSLWVVAGATPTIDRNGIVSGDAADGIRILDPGTDPVVTRNTVTGGVFGIWVGNGAAPTVNGNTVTGAGTGIATSSAAPILEGNIVRANDVGLALDTPAARVRGNTVCDNGVDLQPPTPSLVSADDNTICGTSA